MDPGKLSIREIIGKLTVPQIWIVLVALFGTLAGSFGLGSSLATKFNEAKHERLSMETDALKRESQVKTQEIQKLQEKLKDQNQTIRQYEQSSDQMKARLESRVSQLEAQFAAQSSLVAIATRQPK